MQDESTPADGDDAAAATPPDTAGEPETVAEQGRRRRTVIGVVIAAVAVVVLAAFLWPSNSDDEPSGTAGGGGVVTSSTSAGETTTTAPLAPGATNSEGGRTVTSGPVPSSSTVPDEAPGGAPSGGTSPSSSTPTGGPGAGIPTVPAASITLVSGPSKVFRANAVELSCGSNTIPFVVRAPTAQSVVLRWTTGSANGEVPMERSGEEWTAILVGPMSQQPTIEVRAIGGDAAGSMGTSEPTTAELADCPG